MTPNTDLFSIAIRFVLSVYCMAYKSNRITNMFVLIAIL